MTEVMTDVVGGGKVDLLVATHEHWDHVSGFIQAASAFAQLKVDNVWLAWTENPRDEDAKQLISAKSEALKLLQTAALHLQCTSGVDTLFTSLTEFFGAPAAATTRDALEAVRKKVPLGMLRYCDPADAPFELPKFNARIYVLGPPRDIALLKRVDPSKKNTDESYQTALARFAATETPVINGVDADAPFADVDSMTFAQAKDTPFFHESYFDSLDWRRIDADWMLGADALALALDNMTNNTSLVLAIEIDDKDVLLFAADAQVGNWLSWSDRRWKVNGKTVSGPDLLDRTILYKVGHHGSVNATLKAKGLDLMKNLQVAVIPVDHEMAVKKKWGALPLAPLVKALTEATADRGSVLRTDQPPPPGTNAASIGVSKQYVEVSL
jgi:hypothetical protein